VTPDSHAIFSGIWPSHYDAGGINIKLHVVTDGTVSTANGLQFELSVENTASTDDLDDTGGEDFNVTPVDLDITPSGTAYQLVISGNAAISHANCGSPAVGSGFRLLVARDFDAVTNTDTALLLEIEVTEQ
jgi:hypothetical protein